MSTVSTSNLYHQTIGEALAVQTQWSTAETQQSSGLVAQDFGDLGGSSTRESLNLETDIAQAQSWATQAQNIGSMTQGMYTAVGNMTSEVSKLQVLISQALSSPNNSDLLQQAQSIQSSLLTQVNQQVGGSYLFAGSNTDEAPVSLTNYPTLTSSGAYSSSTADTGYYTGNNAVLSVQVNLQETLSYGVKANNPAIEQALRAVQAVIQAAQVSSTSTATATSPTAVPSGVGGSVTVNGTTFTIASGATLDQIAASINSETDSTGIAAQVLPDSSGAYHLQLTNSDNAITITNDSSGLGLQNASPLSQSAQTSALQAALRVSDTAVTDLGNLQQSISNTSSQLNAAYQQQTTFVTYLQNSLSNVKDVDSAQAAAQVQQYQTQLQASYLAVASLTKLSLAQYL